MDVDDIRDRLSELPGVQFIVFRESAPQQGVLQVALNPYKQDVADELRALAQQLGLPKGIELDIQPGRAELYPG